MYPGVYSRKQGESSPRGVYRLVCCSYHVLSLPLLVNQQINELIRRGGLLISEECNMFAAVVSHRVNTGAKN